MNTEERLSFHGTLIFFCVCFIVLFGITSIVGLVRVNNVRDEGANARILRQYEDGSGRILLANGYCTFPAFDSPEDHIECVIKEGK